MNGCSKFLTPVIKNRSGRPYRIAKQLNDLETTIYRELWVGVRNPEGVWGWLGQTRRELKILGRFLTNREASDYFREADIAKLTNSTQALRGIACPWNS